MLFTLCCISEIERAVFAAKRLASAETARASKLCRLPCTHLCNLGFAEPIYYLYQALSHADARGIAKSSLYLVYRRQPKLHVAGPCRCKLVLKARAAYEVLYHSRELQDARRVAGRDVERLAYSDLRLHRKHVGLHDVLDMDKVPD